MKHFTPELLRRFASKEDAIAEAAEVEWERACEEYRKHLRVVEPKLPVSAREFLRDYNMHDAHLIAHEVGKEDDTLSLLFQLDGTESGLQLTYWLRRAKSTFILPERKKGPLEVEWLYDELDVIDKRLFKHSILMTGGVELGLAFHKLQLHPIELRLNIRPGRVRDFRQQIRELVAS